MNGSDVKTTITNIIGYCDGYDLGFAALGKDELVLGSGAFLQEDC